MCLPIVSFFNNRIADKSQVYTQHAYMRPLGVGMFSSWPFHGQTIFTLFERLDNLFCIITIDKKIFYNSITYCYYWCCILFLWLWIYCAMKLPWFWVLMMNMDLSYTNVIQLVITLVTRYIEDLLSLWLMFRFFLVLFNEKKKNMLIINLIP